MHQADFLPVCRGICRDLIGRMVVHMASREDLAGPQHAVVARAAARLLEPWHLSRRVASPLIQAAAPAQHGRRMGLLRSGRLRQP